MSKGERRGQFLTLHPMQSCESSCEKNPVKFTLILGQKEIIDSTLLIRDMENGIQEVIDFGKVIPEIKKRLEKAVVGDT